MKTATYSKTGSGDADAAQQENMVAAWRAFRQAPEEKANALLEAIEPLIESAVGARAGGRLPRADWPDVAQEVRIALTTGGFLLGSRALREISELTASTTGEIVAQLAKTIATQTFWQVGDAMRIEADYQAVKQALQPEMAEVSIEPLHAAAAKLRAVHKCLRRLGYDRRERGCFVRYLRGRMTQRELGRKLGLQQPGISKRIAQLRAALAAARLHAIRRSKREVEV